MSSCWRPAKVSLFTLAAGNHERRKRSDIFFFFFWPGRREVSTGCLARSAAIELKMWFQRERTDIDPHGGVCVRPENATRGSQGRIS